MVEPWNLRADDSRVEDSLPTFLIFCEDEVSEPLYFKWFETDKIKVNPIEGQKSKIENVFKAIVHCLSNDLMETVDGVQHLKKSDTQVWCVFDRDRESQEGEIHISDVSFNESIETAKARGIRVAWSNDAFEFWVLLHFQDVDIDDPSLKSRSAYYDLLTNLFVNYPTPNADLLKVLRYPDFNYKKSLKQRSNFRNIVRPALVDKIKVAIDRAKKIEANHIGSHTSHSDKSPCTLVHHLVEELLRLGAKPI